MSRKRNRSGRREVEGVIKALWMIRLPGRLPFAMVGMKMSYEEALRCARLIWEQCEIE